MRTCFDPTVREYTRSIQAFFRITWLAAVAWLSDGEIERLEVEIGWPT